MRYSMCANGRLANADCCALRILEAATICIALVICAVLLTERIRRRNSRVLGMVQSPEIRNPKSDGFTSLSLCGLCRRLSGSLTLLRLRLGGFRCFNRVSLFEFFDRCLQF